MAKPDFYRNRDFIPDFDAIMTETEARSRALAAQVRIERDVRYGPTARQSFDLVFPPNPAPGAPLHMFIHGGYWRAGSKEAHTLVAAPVIPAGGVAALVSYDLMPAARLAEIVKQVRSAARQLINLAPKIGADASRFTVSGHSAGAHLAALLAAEAPGDSGPPDVPPIRGMLLVSGIYDLTDIPGCFLKDEAEMRVDEATSWSVLTARQLPVPLRVITCGAKETAPFQDQAIALNALLSQEGQHSELRSEADLNHLTVVLNLSDPNLSLGKRLSKMVASS